MARFTSEPGLKRNLAIQELKTIPGVGVKIADDFWNIGIRSINDLKSADPEKLYAKICKYQGQYVDRCMLYVCRCAVYFAKEKSYDPNLLKWWNWSDKNLKKKKKT